VAEGARDEILAGEAHRIILEKQRAEGERLTGRQSTPSPVSNIFALASRMREMVLCR